MEYATLTLPNGFRPVDGDLIREVTVRAFGADDLNFIRSRAEAKREGFISNIIKRGIVALGGIEDPKEIAKLYDKWFLAADELYLLVQYRIHSIGKQYRIDIVECPVCEEEHRPPLNLENLPVDDQGQDFWGMNEITLPLEDSDGDPLGSEITFRPLRVSDQPAVTEIGLKHDSKRATMEAMLQLIKVDGEVASSALFEPGGKLASYKAVHAVATTMDSAFGGVDFEIKHRCGNKQRTFKTNMRIDPVDFFFPPARGTVETTTAESTRSSGTTVKYSRLADRAFKFQK